MLCNHCVRYLLNNVGDDDDDADNDDDDNVKININNNNNNNNLAHIMPTGAYESPFRQIQAHGDRTKRS